MGKESKQPSFKKKNSRGALKDITKYQTNGKKKKKSRPTSAKNNAKNSRPESGKRERSFRSMNQSKSKDRLKINKHNLHKKTSEKLNLKNLKNTQKPSSLKGLLSEINRSEIKKNRPPKAPTQTKINFKENIGINLKRMNLKKSRSRQDKILDNKTTTIQVSPKLSSILEFRNNPLKRKSSLVQIKQEGALNFNFTKNYQKISKSKSKSKSILHNTYSEKGLKGLYSTEKDLRSEDSTSEFMFVGGKEDGRMSKLESFNKDKPEIEFVVNLFHFLII